MILFSLMQFLSPLRDHDSREFGIKGRNSRTLFGPRLNLMGQNSHYEGMHICLGEFGFEE
jgi:hypothetical protein